MKYFIIILLSAIANSQSFDSPRDLVKDKKSSNLNYEISPGFTFKYHNIGNQNLIYFDENIGSANNESYGVSLRFDIIGVRTQHGIDLNVNFGSISQNLNASPAQTNDFLVNFPANFNYNFTNIDLTYHYYLFAGKFSVFAGTGFYLISDIGLTSRNWTRVYEAKNGETISEIAHKWESKNLFNGIFGAEYISSILGVDLSIAVIYSRGLAGGSLEDLILEESKIMSISNWILNDLQWRVSLSYPIDL